MKCYRPDLSKHQSQCDENAEIFRLEVAKVKGQDCMTVVCTWAMFSTSALNMDAGIMYLVSFFTQLSDETAECTQAVALDTGKDYQKAVREICQILPTSLTVVMFSATQPIYSS